MRDKINALYDATYNAIIQRKDYEISLLDVWKLNAIETGLLTFPEPLKNQVELKFIELCNSTVSKYDLINSKSRKRNVALERQCVCYIANKVFKLSLSEIGRKLNRHHTTILHSVNLIETLVKEPRFAPSGCEILNQIISIPYCGENL